MSRERLLALTFVLCTALCNAANGNCPYLQKEEDIAGRCNSSVWRANAYKQCKGKPFFIFKVDETKTGKEGQAIKLHCCASEYEKLVWSKDGTEVNVDYTRTFIGLNGQLLLITQAQARDKGKYTCSLYRDGRVAKSATIHLYKIEKVHDPFTVKTKPQNASVYPMQNAVFRVDVAFNGGNIFKEIIWYETTGNKTIIRTFDKIPRIQIKERKQTNNVAGGLLGGRGGAMNLTQTLTIQNVITSDFGRTFECIITNGKFRKEYTLAISEAEYNFLTYPPTAIELKNPGDNAKFICAADFGKIPPHLRSIKWYINNRPITSTNHSSRITVNTTYRHDMKTNFVNESLFISGVTKADYSKKFTCRIKVHTKNDVVHRARIKRPTTSYLSLAVSLGVTIGLLLLLLGLSWEFKEEIRLTWRDQLKPKIIRNKKSKKTFAYDFMLMSSTRETDETEKFFVNILVNEYGYKCFYPPNDAVGGVPLQTELVRGLKNSRIAVTVFSPDSLKDPNCDYILQQTAAIEVPLYSHMQFRHKNPQGKKMCFIRYNPVSDWSAVASDRKEAIRAQLNVSKTITWPIHRQSWPEKLRCVDRKITYTSPDLKQYKFDKFYKKLRLAIGQPMTLRQQQATA